MIYFPVKSLPNSANPSGINRYKIRKNNPLHFQHLRHHLVSAHSKGTSTPLDSAVTRPLSITPVQSTLTKNRGEGGSIGTSNQKLQFLSETESRELPTDDYFLNRSIALRHAGHWLAPGEAEGSLVTGHCLCYNS